MELVYVYIESFSNLLKNKSYNFSRNLNIEFDKNSKEIKIVEDKTIPNIFNNNLTNISAIVGKNGEGKTTLLDLLGLQYYKRRNEEDEYFILYKENSDKYIVEGVGLDLLRCLVKNVPEETSSKYSIICSFEKNILIFKEYMRTNDNCIKYINISEKYSLRHEGSFSYNRHENTIFFERLFGHNNVISKYRYISNLLDNSMEKLNFDNNNIYMKIEYKYFELDEYINFYREEFEEDVDILLNKMGIYYEHILKKIDA